MLKKKKVEFDFFSIRKYIIFHVIIISVYIIWKYNSNKYWCTKQEYDYVYKEKQ